MNERMCAELEAYLEDGSRTDRVGRYVGSAPDLWEAAWKAGRESMREDAIKECRQEHHIGGEGCARAIKEIE